MNPALWMTAAGAGSWLTAAAFVDDRTRWEMLFGMLGPLAAVVGSWVLVERTFRQQPERVTATMIASFAFKVVFFGAYVAFMLRVLSLRVVPFAASFTGYFAGLYLMEALYLRRLFR